ncbi:MAG: hypothetical protein JO112_21230 [Planctomycetes bacterium]|nr:hypothetical protein [Planctomycetota bacterium]
MAACPGGEQTSPSLVVVVPDSHEAFPVPKERAQNGVVVSLFDGSIKEKTCVEGSMDKPAGGDRATIRVAAARPRIHQLEDTNFSKSGAALDFFKKSCPQIR